MTPIAIMISGRGSIMNSIVRASDQLQVDVRAVISNNPDAPGLALARQAGIQTKVVDHRAFTSRDAFEKELSLALDSHSPELIILAGFMRILNPAFVERYLGRLINIHPSLLPRYPGLRTHARAIEAGDSEHGASIHFVTPELDGGPVIAQTRIAIPADSTPESLAARLLPYEHRLMLNTLELFTHYSVELRDNRVYLDNRLMEEIIEF